MKPLRSRILPVLWILLSGALVFFSGCQTRKPPAGMGTNVASRLVVPAHVASNFFFIESEQANGKTYRFLIDTGSSATLVSTELAREFRMKEKGPVRTTRVRGAQGGDVELENATLKLLSLGDARFDRVPVLIYNFTELSNHLGRQVDGVIGFPLFRHTLLTLDYPNQQLVLSPTPLTAAPPDESNITLIFSYQQGRPFIPLQMGNESFSVLIDSGSDASLSLNPTGLHPRFVSEPRVGTIVTTLTGDHRQLVARLDGNVLLGTQIVEQPIVDLTQQLSSIGGEFLRHFAVTFDQSRNRVTFARDAGGPLATPPRRSTGFSFTRSAPYWRVATVVPNSPATTSGIQSGDLCVRINGEPVEKWDLERYAQLIRTAPKVTYTFLNGAHERDIEAPVFDLVP